MSRGWSIIQIPLCSSSVTPFNISAPSENRNSQCFVSKLKITFRCTLAKNTILIYSYRNIAFHSLFCGNRKYCVLKELPGYDGVNTRYVTFFSPFSRIKGNLKFLADYNGSYEQNMCYQKDWCSIFTSWKTDDMSKGSALSAH